jgi:ABC-2 type transport system ATP-binding protein
MSAIDLQGIVKVYARNVAALQGVDLRVEKGQIFGLLGPNGAGKTTLLKIILTLVRPTRGGGSVLGGPLGYVRTLAHVGYLPENPRFPRYLSGAGVLDLFSALSGLTGSERKRRLAELLDLVGMSAAARRKTSTYSKGMLQRIGIGQAIAHDPELLLLDEPTDGVDPEGRRDIRNLLLRLREQGKTVFVNSHMLSELEMICDRVAILVGGRVVKTGTLDELTAGQQRYEVELAVPPGSEAWAVTKALPGVFAAGTERGQLPGGCLIERKGTLLRLHTTDAAIVERLVLDPLRAAAVTVRRMEIVRPSLEDLFMQAVQPPPRPGSAEKGTP